MNEQVTVHTSQSTEPAPAAVWFARAAVALVCIWNLTAAVPFVLRPANYLHSFELDGAGIGAEAVVRGLGIAFLMWQVPFVPVILRPGRQRACHLCVLGMQLIGLLGESLMLIALPDGHAPLRATAWRFITFDATGLVLIGLAYMALSRAPDQDRTFRNRPLSV